MNWNILQKDQQINHTSHAKNLVLERIYKWKNIFKDKRKFHEHEKLSTKNRSITFRFWARDSFIALRHFLIACKNDDDSNKCDISCILYIYPNKFEKQDSHNLGEKEKHWS